MEYKIFKANTVGRDFVIGDLHGNYGLLENLMDHVNFDKSVDRLFSVGDLIDRGPESFKCLKLIDESWFFPVMGNHEDMCLSFVKKDGRYRDAILKNGGAWLLDLSSEELEEVQNLLEKMPKIITVKGKFHIVHSELGTDFRDDEEFENSTYKNVLKSSDRYGCPRYMWDRNYFYDACGQVHDQRLKDYYKSYGYLKEDSISNIYCGHTPVSYSPVRVGNHVNLDTCAFATGKASAGLSIIEHDTQTIYKANSFGIERVEIFDLSV